MHVDNNQGKHALSCQAGLDWDHLFFSLHLDMACQSLLTAERVACEAVYHRGKLRWPAKQGGAPMPLPLSDA
jgi:hypothetical protein